MKVSEVYELYFFLSIINVVTGNDIREYVNYDKDVFEEDFEGTIDNRLRPWFVFPLFFGTTVSGTPNSIAC